MNPLKQFLKLHRLELEARACVDRSYAQKLIRKAENAKRKLEGSAATEIRLLGKNSCGHGETPD